MKLVALPGVASMPISCNICSTAFTFFVPRLDGSFIRDERKLVPELFVSGNLIPADSSEAASFVGLFEAMRLPENEDFFFDDFLSAGVPARLPPEASLTPDVDESAWAINF